MATADDALEDLLWGILRYEDSNPPLRAEGGRLSYLPVICASTEESTVIRTKSAYEPKSPEDGYRVFIEPTWPRDLPKGKALGADWMRELYPSQGLREWMRLNPRKADLFRDRYLLELAHNEKAVEKVRKLHQERRTLTVLTVPVAGPWDIYETLAGYLRVMCE